MCEYCKENREVEVMYTAICNNVDLEVFIESERELCVNAFNHETEFTEDICFSFKISFCPMCGRKLGGE